MKVIIPLLQDYTIRSATKEDTLIQNAIIQTVKNGRTFIESRPAFDRISPAGTNTNVEGRGMFYWDNQLFMAFGAKLFRYGNPWVEITVGGGDFFANTTGRVFFADIGDKLIVIEPNGVLANNTGTYITSSTATTGTRITDADFPPNATFAISLADGQVQLNDRSYVLSRDGVIYNSDLSDGTSWSATFISAIREKDQGLYIGKHHNHIVTFGYKSIEFFYDAGLSSPAAPIARRNDISYNIGLKSSSAIWEIGDVIYFVSNDISGSNSVYKIENFKLSKISTLDIDEISSVGATEMGGLEYRGIHYPMIADTSNVRKLYVLDSSNGIWSVWTQNADAYGVPFISRYGSLGYIVLKTNSSNEAVFKLNDAVTTDDGGSSNGSTIDFAIRTAKYRGGKDSQSHSIFYREFNIIGDTESSAITVKWSDDDYQTWTSGRSVLMSNTNKRLYRLGQAKERAFELSSTGHVRVEGIEVDVSAGGT